jgi:hypothetical protein
LGLKGSLSEYELDLLRQRSLEARRQKAARGELLVLAPVGYLKTAEQRLEKDPDQRVQESVARVFEKFLQLGTVRQTLLWFLEHGFELPVRRYGASGWETIWKRPCYRPFLRMLRDPTYAGAYCYGRTVAVSEVRDGELRHVRQQRPRGEWSVLIRDHHESYIAWDTFERIQHMISGNVCSPADGSGAPKMGLGLLVGLLRCRRCGRKLMVVYTGTNHSVPRYCCRRGSLDNGEPRCLSFGGLAADQAVSREILRVLEPAAIEAAHRGALAQCQRDDDVLRALRLDLQAAQYAAERAGKQYDAADPSNRLVADELERRWNLALERLQQLESKIRTAEAEHQKVDPPDAAILTDLAHDFDRVWNDPRTDQRLKKRILRALLNEVIADVDVVANEVELTLHWKGGIHSVLRVARRRRGQNGGHTATTVVEAVRELARVCTDDMIAAVLNRNGLRTGRGNRWTRERVTALRSHQRIPVYSTEVQSTGRWMKLGEAAARLGVAPKTLRLAAERGEVQAVHPLPDGPWVFAQEALDAALAAGFIQQHRATHPAGPSVNQLALKISTT